MYTNECPQLAYDPQRVILTIALMVPKGQRLLRLSPKGNNNKLRTASIGEWFPKDKEKVTLIDCTDCSDCPQRVTIAPLVLKGLH